MNTSTQKKTANLKLLSKEQEATYDGFTSIAAKVRFLATITTSRGDISRYMSHKEGREVRYQWVRNVLETPLKKGE